MSLHPTPEGLQIDLENGKYKISKVSREGLHFWAIPHQNVILQSLGGFLPRVTDFAETDKKKKTFTYKMVRDGSECCSASTALGDRALDEGQRQALHQCITDLQAKGEHPVTPPDTKEAIRKFKLPDPKKLPDFYRLDGRGRLMILWGCVTSDTDLIPPAQVLSILPQPPPEPEPPEPPPEPKGLWARLVEKWRVLPNWLRWLLWLLLLLLLLWLLWYFLEDCSNGAGSEPENDSTIATTEPDPPGLDPGNVVPRPPDPVVPAPPVVPDPPPRRASLIPGNDDATIWDEKPLDSAKFHATTLIGYDLSKKIFALAEPGDSPQKTHNFPGEKSVITKVGYTASMGVAPNIELSYPDGRAAYVVGAIIVNPNPPSDDGSSTQKESAWHAEAPDFYQLANPKWPKSFCAPTASANAVWYLATRQNDSIRGLLKTRTIEQLGKSAAANLLIAGKEKTPSEGSLAHYMHTNENGTKIGDSAQGLLDYLEENAPQNKWEPRYEDLPSNAYDTLILLTKEIAGKSIIILSIKLDTRPEPDKKGFLCFLEGESVVPAPSLPPAPPVAPPDTKPVAPPIAPTDTKPVAPPVAPPDTKPVAPPDTKPVAPPVAPPDTKPVAPPIAPPDTKPVAPPDTKPVAPPVAPPDTKPVAPPAQKREDGAIEGDFDIFIPDLKPEDLRLNLPFKSHFRLKLEMSPKNTIREFDPRFTWIIDNEEVKRANDSQIVQTLLEGEHVIELQATKGANKYFKRKKLRLEMVNDKPSWKWLK